MIDDIKNHNANSKQIYNNRDSLSIIADSVVSNTKQFRNNKKIIIKGKLAFFIRKIMSTFILKTLVKFKIYKYFSFIGSFKYLMKDLPEDWYN